MLREPNNWNYTKTVNAFKNEHTNLLILGRKLTKKILCGIGGRRLTLSIKIN